MTSRLLISIILTSICACTSGGQELTPLLNQHEKFTADGKVSEDKLYGFPTYHEDGSLNGVAYRIYFLDGSGTFEGVKGNGIDLKETKNRNVKEGLKNIEDLEKNWKIGCREDAVDVLTCLMIIPGITVFVDTKGQNLVAIHGGNSDPRGTIVGIRLDNGVNFVGGKDSQFDGTTAKQIIDGLKTAKQVTTEFRRANSSVGIAKTLDLYGFNEAFSYINWIMGKCKKVYNARIGIIPNITGGGFQTCNSR
jgi:hypothetical protein